MLKIFSIALALAFSTTLYAQAADEPPAPPSQNEQMQRHEPPQHQKMRPNGSDNENMTPPNGEITPPDGNQPPKGKRPNKKPDSKPGGDMTPPEFSSNGN